MTRVGSSCVEVTSESSEDQLSDNGRRFRATCKRLGMDDSAAVGWEEWDVKPMRSVLVCMGSVVGCCCIVMLTFLLGCPLDSWYPLVCIIGYGVSQVVQWGFYWRKGPRHAGTPAHYVGAACLLLNLFALMIPAIAGPLPLVPFRNRLLTTILLTAAVFLITLSGYTGASAPDKPLVPFVTLTAPLLKSTWITVRVMDPVTDMILVRMILELVRFPSRGVPEHSLLVVFCVFVAHMLVLGRAIVPSPSGCSLDSPCNFQYTITCTLPP